MCSLPALCAELWDEHETEELDLMRKVFRYGLILFVLNGLKIKGIPYGSTNRSSNSFTGLVS